MSDTIEHSTKIKITFLDDELPSNEQSSVDIRMDALKCKLQDEGFDINFVYMNVYKTTEIKDKLIHTCKNHKEFIPDAIICDIEIWDKPVEDNNRLLVAFGLTYLEELLRNGYDKRPYFILTNCTSNLQGTIERELQRLNNKAKIIFHNKDKALSAISQYVERIKTEIKESKNNHDRVKEISEQIKQFDIHIKNQESYSKKPILLSINGISKNCEKYEETLDFMTNIFNGLKQKFVELNVPKGDFNDKNGGEETNIYKLRQLFAKIGYGNDISNFTRSNDSFDDKNWALNFVKKLILRKFAIYISEYYFKNENEIGNGKSNLWNTCLYLSNPQENTRSPKLFDNRLGFSNPADPTESLLEEEKQ